MCWWQAAAVDAEGDEVIDEEEYRMIKDLSTAKKTYRSHYDALRDAKGPCPKSLHKCSFKGMLIALQSSVFICERYVLRLPLLCPQ